MAIASTLEKHLTDQGIGYELVAHPRTPSSTRTAQAAHVSGERVAKTVVLHDVDGYLLAVVPATHRVELEALQRLLDRRLNLATEEEIGRLFSDCDVGAVPPIGAAYGLEVVLDESLGGQTEICFEAGDHTSLVQVSAQDFETLMAAARRGRFSHHV